MSMTTTRQGCLSVMRKGKPARINPLRARDCASVLSAMSPKRMAAIRLKRAYEPPAKSDGLRILVDWLWPRKVSRTAARIDLWLKETAPSDALREWFGHDPSKWNEFRKRYFRELEKRRETVAQLKQFVNGGTVTLVYGAKDERHNNAVALKEYPESI